MSGQKLSLVPGWLPTPYVTFLATVADIHGVGQADNAYFLAACRLAADLNHGKVSVNVVARILAEAGIDIEHHRYASFWSQNTGGGRAMAWLGEWETRDGSRTRNDGKPVKVRAWVGWEPPSTAALRSMPATPSIAA